MRRIYICSLLRGPYIRYRGACVQAPAAIPASMKDGQTPAAMSAAARHWQ